MAETIRVGLPDGSEREFPAGTTVLEVAEAIGPRLAKDTVAGMVNGTYPWPGTSTSKSPSRNQPSTSIPT